jgi:hypothetical protein
MLQARIQQEECPFLREYRFRLQGWRVLQEIDMKDTFLRNISLPSSGSNGAPSKNPAKIRHVSKRNIASFFRAEDTPRKWHERHVSKEHIASIFRVNGCSKQESSRQKARF